MLSEISSILPIIVAGIMNGSFVIPAKYIPNYHNEKIWLYHSVIGLAIIPWVFFVLVLPNEFHNYFNLSCNVLISIIVSGMIFGIGQLWFAKSIQYIGLALSFTINLGIGLTIGSMFVIFYKSAFLTEQGILVTFAILLILCSLIIYYHAGKQSAYEKLNDNYHNYIKGWVLTSLAGMTSGLQNITFFLTAFHANTPFQTSNSFWVWPPFLLAASIPMFFGLRHKINDTIKYPFLSVKNLFLVVLMGLFFTGSLAIYSKGMSQLNHQQQMIGWPAFIVSIILSSQIWGLLYKEMPTLIVRNKILKFISVILLLIAIFILAYQA